MPQGGLEIDNVLGISLVFVNFVLNIIVNSILLI